MPVLQAGANCNKGRGGAKLRRRALYMPFYIEKQRRPMYNKNMNKPDYDKLMQQEIKKLNDRKATLLLHSCCAPCSSACLERLKDYFRITVFYYNPNIEDEEYSKRKAEQIRFIKETGWADIADCEHDAERFYDMSRGLEDCPEGGARCLKCYELRIRRTAEEAEKLGFEYFATTLTVSPLKSSAAINAIGEKVAAEFSANWLYSDFKKRNGYLRSCQLAGEHNLYRQNYCGCEFSRKARENGEINKS